MFLKKIIWNNFFSLAQKLKPIKKTEHFGTLRPTKKLELAEMGIEEKKTDPIFFLIGKFVLDVQNSEKEKVVQNNAHPEQTIYKIL